ncbi:DUF4212 domain-containing protein [Pandoraea sp. ISTKB]|uniref:DUF4212 domain-containing protein n=1 Tax=Pandoraea sp. ISTKB TaxID=1586708 RepID=UPI000847B1AE|nr:DUF4212 domain-containing protein [Pandoraea sp. ISTKB]ODP34482.1 hypothetical protein A9762_14970 [Pandoraea sp. ISTKB]
MTQRSRPGAPGSADDGGTSPDGMSGGAAGVSSTSFVVRGGDAVTSPFASGDHHDIASTPASSGQRGVSPMSPLSPDATGSHVGAPNGATPTDLSPDIDWHGQAAAIAARHWRRTLWLVAVLMGIGFVVTFVPQFWAREWAAMRFAGWPLPFYMGAQGSILVDIGLIVVYALFQRLNDARYRKALHALRDARRDSLGLTDDTLESAMAPATSRSASSRAESAHIYR